MSSVSIDELVARGLELLEGEGGTGFEALCSQHPAQAEELRKRIDKLREMGLVGRPGQDGATMDNRPEIAGFEIGQRVGVGGMGEVYRAQQVEPVRRIVALKVIRGGMATAEVLRRFAAERQVLAHLNHPGIAHIFDAGVTEDGRPFFAMEFVAGASITAWCDANRATIEQRVRLGIEVAETVQFAHRHAVIHRDIKPSNILMEVSDDRARPKLIDFGLARVVDESDRSSSLVTEVGQVLGTPEYMSPEQADSSSTGIDTRTDIHALGALLFELVTGSTPFRHDGARSGPSLVRLLERIRTEAAPVSSRFVSSRSDGRELARLRGENSVGSLAVRVRGELDWIIGRALEKNPDDRYQTADALARDLRAHLDGLPVEAGAPSTWHVLRKTMRRHRVALGVAAAILLTVLIGGILATVQWQRAETYLEQFDALQVRDRLVDRIREAELELWPLHPDTIPQWQSWLEEVEPMLSLRAGVRKQLESLREDRGRVDPQSGVWSFDGYAYNVLHSGLVAATEAFARLDGPDGLVAGIRGRIDWSERLHRKLDQHAAEWAEAIRSIRDDCVAYRGLEIVPQLGLVPLAVNEFGLWEFLHLHPGSAEDIPTDAGRWRIEPATGLVFVLLPGGVFNQGAQSAEPDGLNYDELAAVREGPVTPVELAPFFLSKYELTGGQWERLTGQPNPSLSVREFAEVTSTHPVQNVSWAECDFWLRTANLTIPTEAQWEYAARGGTSTPWWTGLQPESLATGANLRDRAYAGDGGMKCCDWYDGHVATARVDRLDPNPFGLFQILGNVAEWCADREGLYDVPARAGDGLRQPAAKFIAQTLRGGYYEGLVETARSAARLAMTQHSKSGGIGVRPARPLLPNN